MAREGSRSNKALSHRQFRSLLRTFRPSDAAFVLHLANCERCRRLATRLLDPETTDPVSDYLGFLSPLERDFILDITRGGYLLRLADEALADQGDDLPPTELRRFLESLEPQQSALIRHLLACQTCRHIAAKALAPKNHATAPSESLPHTDLAV